MREIGLVAIIDQRVSGRVGLCCEDHWDDARTIDLVRPVILYTEKKKKDWIDWKRLTARMQAVKHCLDHKLLFSILKMCRHILLGKRRFLPTECSPQDLGKMLGKGKSGKGNSYVDRRPSVHPAQRQPSRVFNGSWTCKSRKRCSNAVELSVTAS